MVNNPTIIPFPPKQRKSDQECVGLFCHYASYIGTTMLASFSPIATNMTTETKKDLDFRMKLFLDYAVTHFDARIRYIASGMQLWCHSGASYLSEPKALLRADGHFDLSK